NVRVGEGSRSDYGVTSPADASALARGELVRATSRNVYSKNLRPGDVIKIGDIQKTVERIAGVVDERLPGGGTFRRMARPGERPATKLENEHYLVFSDGSAIKRYGANVERKYGNTAEVRRKENEASSSAA